MEDGVDEEEARAGRLGRWIPWETEEWVVQREHRIDYPFPLSLSLLPVQGDHTPSFAHSAPMGV
jgi:hypothetical protein